MGLFDKLFGPSTTDESYYALVSEEIASGQIRPGLWAIALADCGYDETKAKAIYLKLRVKTLKEELKQAENSAFAELSQANKQGDVNRARELALPLANIGNAYGIYCHGCYSLDDAKSSQDAEQAIGLLNSVAKEYPDAHFRIGRAFCYGTNYCQVNGDIAFQQFVAGAKVRNVGCQYELGLMYVRSKAWGDARKWLEAAKFQGHLDAAHELSKFKWYQ